MEITTAIVIRKKKHTTKTPPSNSYTKLGYTGLSEFQSLSVKYRQLITKQHGHHIPQS